MKRLFIGIALPRSIINTISDCKERINDTKWVDDENLHITLCFLGDVDMPSQIEIHNELIQIKQNRFSLKLMGVGHFSNRILYASIDPKEDLLHLQKKIKSSIKQLNIRVDRKKYHPHITLARMKYIDENNFIPFLQKHALLKSDLFEINEFNLYSSELSPKGASYHIEMTYKLIN